MVLIYNDLCRNLLIVIKNIRYFIYFLYSEFFFWIIYINQHSGTRYLYHFNILPLDKWVRKPRPYMHHSRIPIYPYTIYPFGRGNRAPTCITLGFPYILIPYTPLGMETMPLHVSLYHIPYTRRRMAMRLYLKRYPNHFADPDLYRAH
jgi:hypothetical protein